MLVVMMASELKPTAKHADVEDDYDDDTPDVDGDELANPTSNTRL